MKLPFVPSLRESARQLRKNQTLSEYLFWQEIKGRKILGYKFLRQKSILSYIVDFYCVELKLAIELDGEVHLQRTKEDALRTKELETLGLTIIRFTNNEIHHSIQETLYRLINHIHCIERNSPALASRRAKGGG